MNNFLLTLFLLLVLISLYSILINSKRSEQKSQKKSPVQPSNLSVSSSTSFSTSSESSTKNTASTANFQTSQPPQPSSSYVSSPTPTITVPSNHHSLAQKIQGLGKSNSLDNITSILNYLTHSDPLIRISVAETLGNLVSTKNIRNQARKAILSLGRLSRDPNLSVRLAAVKALGKIKSPLVIPFLKLAQKDVDSNVIKSASAALNYFKKSPLSSQKKVTNKPKNVAKQWIKKY